MAQWEIRRLFQLVRHEIFAVSPFLGSFLAPKCVPLGYCDEMGNRDEHCPIRAAQGPRPGGMGGAGRRGQAGDPPHSRGRPRAGPATTRGPDTRPADDDPAAVRPDPAEVEIGPHRHGRETIVFVASGAIVFEHGDDLERRVEVRAGDVLYEAPSEYHLVRNDGRLTRSSSWPRSRRILANPAPSRAAGISPGSRSGGASPPA